jgi:hypothetical protein
VGLGILANNNQRGQFAPAFGAGMQQGLNNVTAYRQQQQMNDLRQQQIDNQKYLFDVRKQEVDQQNAQRVAEQQAIAEAQKLRPDLAPLLAIDPKAAMKALYPQAGGADPFTQIEYDNEGRAWLNNRRETDPSKVLQPIIIDGKPFIGAKQSPELAGRIEGSKSYNKNLYEPTDQKDGYITSKSALAIESGSPPPQLSPTLPPFRGNLPYAPTWNGQPMGAEGTTATDRQEGINSPADIRVGNPSSGIRVPTKAEQQAAIDAAKDLEEKKRNLPKVIEDSNYSIKLIDDLLNSKGFGTAVGLSSKIDPRNYIAGTDATNFRRRLDQIKGQQFLQAFNSLKGGGQITEVEGKKATDAISRMDTSLTEDEFKAAAREFQDVIRTGLERAKRGAGQIMPENKQMPQVKALPLPAKPSTLTLKKGSVYNTQKGALRWNGKQFEDL